MEQLKELTIASCNIEGDKHINRVKQFLGDYSPDVVCLQEAIEDNMDDIAQDFNYGWIYLGNNILSKDVFDNFNSDRVSGIAIFSRHPMTDRGSLVYAGEAGSIPVYQRLIENSSRRGLIYASVANKFKIATTHFTWSADGEASQEQFRDVQVLLEKVKPLGDMVLAGDFNTPRPNAVYRQLTSYFTSSLDPNLHRLGRTKDLMVDYVFRTPKYTVRDVMLIEGVSDHKALIARLSINEAARTA